MDKLGTALVITVIATSLYGSLFGDGRRSEARAEEARPRLLFALAQEVIVPYVSAAVEAKPLEEAEAEIESEVPNVVLSREDRRIIAALAEIDALSQAVERGLVRDPHELNGRLAGYIGDVRKAGGTLEEVEERLATFFRTVKGAGFSGDALGWLEDEADIQRSRFAADAKR